MPAKLPYSDDVTEYIAHVALTAIKISVERFAVCPCDKKAWLVVRPAAVTVSSCPISR